MSGYTTLGSVTITTNVTTEPYTPQPGDIIEKGRRRIEYRGPGRSFPSYRRSRFSGEWYHDRWLDISPGIFTMMVRCDGWRLVYRKEPTNT